MRRTPFRAACALDVVTGWVLAGSIAGSIAVSACAASKPAQEPAPQSDAAAEPPPPPPPPPPPAPPAPSLYERLGKKDAIAGIVDELVSDLLADNRIAKAFDKERRDRGRRKAYAEHATAELCFVAGGGDDCAYDGKTVPARLGMNVTPAQWDAFVEDLSIAMKTRGVDDATTKELIDQLNQLPPPTPSATP